MEHLIGYIIIALSVVLTTTFLIIRARQWKRRWDVNKFSGHLVRYDHGALHTPEIGRQVEIAHETLDRKLKDYKPGKSIDWRVEIVPPGKIMTPSVPRGVLRDGSLVGGSVRTERCFPWTKKHWVAVVVNERVGSFIIHEVTRHIAAMVFHGTLDATHAIAPLAALETETKTVYNRALR